MESKQEIAEGKRESMGTLMVGKGRSVLITFLIAGRNMYLPILTLSSLNKLSTTSCFYGILILMSS